jgi:hypothetical protein
MCPIPLSIPAWLKTNTLVRATLSQKRNMDNCRIFGKNPQNDGSRSLRRINFFPLLIERFNPFSSNSMRWSGYSAVHADPRVFKPEDTFDPTDPKFERRRSEGPQTKLDDPEFVESLRDDDD